MADRTSTHSAASLCGRALTTVVAFGVVSLFADIVYEGARSIIGPYLLMFALAMAVDAGVALVSGRTYDRRGLRVLMALPLPSAVAALAFTSTGWVVWAGVATWGQ